MIQAAMAGATDTTIIGLTEAMSAGNLETRMLGQMLQMRGEIL